MSEMTAAAKPAARAPATAAIHDTWKVSQVLDRYPALLETFASLYPGFARLRNPILRALRAPRISVGQAARVAGLEPAALCRALNEAVGLSQPPEPAQEPAEARAPTDQPGAAAADDQPRVVEIDVSALPPPEPMLMILEALTSLPPGGALHVRHARVPVYLYPRLDAMGCAHRTTEVGPGHVELVITKAAASEAASA